MHTTPPRRTLFVGVISTIILILCSLSVWAKPTQHPSTRRAIYPKTTHAIIFSHARHTTTPCATCHQGITKSTKASHSHAPSMQLCVTCHNASPKAPNTQACNTCHLSYSGVAKSSVKTPKDWQSVRPAPMPVNHPQAKLRFSHKTHHDLGVSCQQCHAASKTTGAPSMPSMSMCVSCHTKSPKPQESCSTCHTTKVRPLLAPLTPPRKTVPLTKSVKPLDHTVDWIARHGQIAKASATQCLSCHTEPSCAQCHDATAGNILAAHPPNYIITHRISAAGNSSTCTSCHVIQQDCRSCHAQSKLTPSAAPLKLKYHPPGWVENIGGLGHGQAAKQNIQNCVSCHQEQDCVSCHQGVSPHPAGFQAKCKRLLKANPASCVKCHTNLSALDAQCL